MLCGGFPCQAFSIAGKRGGFEDTRGTLFFDIARVARVKRPQLLFLENVKGLLSHDNGRTFGCILSTLSDLGYFLEWQVLNSKDFGVPQNRERVFIVGHLGGTSKPQVFPVRGSNETDSVENISTAIDSMIQVGNIDQQGHNSLWGRIYSPQGVGSTLNAKGGGLGAKTGLYAVGNKNPSGRGQSGNVYNSQGLFPTLGAGGGNPNRKRDIGWSSGYLEHNMKIRRLTPVECARLQGFPDGWTEGISDSQRYKTLGNAVSVPVIKAIAERIFSCQDNIQK